MKVLGIETSCDETGIAIVEDETVLANLLASQVRLHERFGGVVPELASRAHVEAVTPLLEATLERAGLGFGDLDGVAVTAGPGLVGALLVGLAAAKSRLSSCGTCPPASFGRSLRGKGDLPCGKARVGPSRRGAPGLGGRLRESPGFASAGAGWAVPASA